MTAITYKSDSDSFYSYTYIIKQYETQKSQSTCQYDYTEINLSLMVDMINNDLSGFLLGVQMTHNNRCIFISAATCCYCDCYYWSQYFFPCVRHFGE